MLESNFLVTKSMHKSRQENMFLVIKSMFHVIEGMQESMFLVIKRMLGSKFLLIESMHESRYESTRTCSL